MLFILNCDIVVWKSKKNEEGGNQDINKIVKIKRECFIHSKVNILFYKNSFSHNFFSIFGKVCKQGLIVYKNDKH